MVRVIVVGEGPSEETFVDRVLAHELAPNYIFLYPQLIATSKYSKGGALAFQRVIRHLRDALLSQRKAYVTTLFDLYALPTDFPGHDEGRTVADPLQRATLLEQHLGEAVRNEVGGWPDRFVPHIQPYEFEALLFSDIDQLIQVETGWETFRDMLQSARDNAASPEHINDGATTHPSARLESLRPSYQKTYHSWRAAQDVGLNAMERECAHFRAWLARLRALPPLA